MCVVALDLCYEYNAEWRRVPSQRVLCDCADLGSTVARHWPRVRVGERILVVSEVLTERFVP
jgi:hypothetical protein